MSIQKGKYLEFLELTNLYLQTKFANDTEDVYLSVVEKAKRRRYPKYKTHVRATEANPGCSIKRTIRRNPDQTDMYDDLELD